MKHIDYPHTPGYLHECPACTAQCHCVMGCDKDCSPSCTGHYAECVYEGEHTTKVGPPRPWWIP